MTECQSLPAKAYWQEIMYNLGLRPCSLVSWSVFVYSVDTSALQIWSWVHVCRVWQIKV